MTRLFGNNSYVKQQAQHNFGTQHRAQKRLDHLVSRANSQLETSLQVDSVEIVIFQKAEARGYPCTCANLKKKDPLYVNRDTDPSDESLSDQDRQDGPTPKFIMRTPGKIQKSFPLNESIYKPRTNDNTIEPTRTIDDQVNLGILPEGDQEINDILALLSLGDDSALGAFGGSSTVCGICMSTGWRDNYSLHNGSRFLLEASGFYKFVMNGFILDRETYPYSFTSEFNPSNSVTWLGIELPTFWIKSYNINIRSNTKPTSGLKAEVRISNTLQWFDLTNDFLNSRIGIPTVLDIRVRPSVALTEGLAVFTHLEFVIQYAEWNKGQMPPITPTESLDKVGHMVDTTMVLSSKLAEVKSGDVIYCNKYDDLWKATSVPDAMTAKRQILSWNVSVRAVQSYEVLQNLRLGFNRTVNMAFTGLEQIQGQHVYAGEEHYRQYSNHKFRNPPKLKPKKVSGTIKELSSNYLNSVGFVSPPTNFFQVDWFAVDTNFNITLMESALGVDAYSKPFAMQPASPNVSKVNNPSDSSAQEAWFRNGMYRRNEILILDDFTDIPSESLGNI